MSFLRNVLHDLVQKKLWPVAVALVAAVIAVPIVLGGGSDAPSADPVDSAAISSTSSPATASTAQVVKLEDEASGKAVDRPGKTLDPFVQHHQPKPAASQTTPASTSTPTTTATGQTSAGDTTPASTTTGGTTPTTTTTDTKKTSTKSTYGVTLTFGEEGTTETHRNVARLTPLPSADDPFFIYLGLKADGKSAVFLVDSDAVPSGDGTCEPSPTNCEQVVLKKGDIEFFELQSGTAGVVQYQLEIKDIKTAKASTTASAARAHARESAAGREYIRELVADNPTALDAWSFSSQTGLLVGKDDAATTVAEPAPRQTLMDVMKAVTTAAAAPASAAQGH